MSDTETTDAPEAEVEEPQEDPRISKANQEAAKYRRELRETQKQLEQLRAASMTEQEKAVAEAEARGRGTALAENGPRLVRAEFRAAASGRVDKETLDAYLEDVDLSKFLGDDGEPDMKAIEARVGKLAPQRTSFDGGPRTTAGKPTNMNDLIRRQAGVA